MMKKIDVLGTRNDCLEIIKNIGVSLAFANVFVRRHLKGKKLELLGDRAIQFISEDDFLAITKSKLLFSVYLQSRDDQVTLGGLMTLLETLEGGK